MVTKTAILVVLVSGSSCDLRNIDYAQESTSTYETMQECEDNAAILDDAENVRAFCIEASQ